MSDKVQIICRGCDAKLSMPGTLEDIVNRKVRCPKCQMKFVARPEMVRVVTAAEVTKSAKPAAASTPAKRKAPKPAEEIFDDGDDFDDVEILEDDEDELPAAPRTSSSRSKRASPRDELDDLPAPTKKKKKKKSKPASERSFGTAVLLWTLGGILGGLIGGGVWGGVAYSTGYHVGFLSILIGTTVGIGVRLGAAQYEGLMPALTAVGLTLIAVFISKFTLNYTIFADDLPGFGGNPGDHIAAMSEEDIIGKYIDEVVGPEYRKQGKAVENPRWEEDEDFDDFSTKAMYDPALWTDAETRWKAMPPQEQAAFRQNIIDRDLGIDRKSLIAHVAEKEIKPEFEQAGKPVMLTEAEIDAMEDFETEFKPEVMTEAETRFDAKSPEQKTALIESIRAEQTVAAETAKGIMLGFVLIYTVLSFLWPSNLICLILACISAYQIGNYDGITT